MILWWESQYSTEEILIVKSQLHMAIHFFLQRN